MKSLLIIHIIAILFVGCAEKEIDPTDSERSFVVAKEAYDDENFEMALGSLAEFKARFPYSKYAVEAELLIANSHYNMEHFVESSYSYAQFAKLHPKHPKVDFALYRVGASYWADAPSDIDREQEYTAKALYEWSKLVEQFPASEYTKKAKKSMKEGRLRLAEAEEFVAKFYCRQKIWHACAHRNIKIADKFKEYKELQIRSVMLAAMALEKLAEQKKKDPENDKNLYFRNLNADQILEKAKLLRNKAEAAKNVK